MATSTSSSASSSSGAVGPVQVVGGVDLAVQPPPMELEWYDTRIVKDPTKKYHQLIDGNGKVVGELQTFGSARYQVAAKCF